MSRPPFKPIADALPRVSPFVGPETMQRQTGRVFRARLGANESGFGPSPRAIAAMQSAAAAAWKYADPDSFELREALAQFHGVPRDTIVIGEGIDGLLGLTCDLFLSPGDRVVTTDGAYPTFNFHVARCGGVLERVPMRELREDLDALLARAAATRASLMYVSNPNNPVGSHWIASDLEACIGRLPTGCMLILDEAYCDTAPAGTAPPLDVTADNVVRYRTFSKAYGLAGARIGYAIGHPDVIAGLDRMRNQYGINIIGQVGAQAALHDQAYLSEAVDKIARARGIIARMATANGLTPLPSATGFVAIDCGRDGAFASDVLQVLLDLGVFARKPQAPSLAHMIRVSTGLDADLDVFGAALPKALEVAQRVSLRALAK